MRRPNPQTLGGFQPLLQGKKLSIEEKKGGEKSNTCVKCGPSQKKGEKRVERVHVCVIAADARKKIRCVLQKDQKRGLESPG